MELMRRGPVQAVMRVYPMLRSYNLVLEQTRSLSKGEEVNVSAARGDRILVYRCDEKLWRQRRARFPDSLATMGRSHAVRIVGFGSANREQLIVPLGSNSNSSSGASAELASRPAIRDMKFEPYSRRRTSDLQTNHPRPDGGQEGFFAAGAGNSRRRKSLSHLRAHDVNGTSVKKQRHDESVETRTLLEPWIIESGDAAASAPASDVGAASDSVRYWIVANSWGHDFGDRGFFYVEQGRHDCGISIRVYAP